MSNNKGWKVYLEALDNCVDATVKTARCAKEAAVQTENAADHALIASAHLRKYFEGRRIEVGK